MRSRKLISCLLSLSIVLSSQVSASTLNDTESHYYCQEISQKNLNPKSKNSESLLSKIKNFIIYPASLLIPPGILALMFGSKKLCNYLQSEKSLSYHDKINSGNDTAQVKSTSNEINHSQTSLLPLQDQNEKNFSNEVCKLDESTLEAQEERERKEQEKRKREERALNKANKIKEKLRECVEINNERNAMVSITGPTIIIGDLHGALNSAALVRDQVEKFLSESKNNNAVFLGDYLNAKLCRDESFEVLNIITDLQIKYNKRVVLLRGNHEESYNDDFNNFKYFGEFTSDAGMIDEQLKKINSTTIKDFCNSLPIAAEVTNNDQKILCLHGFIPSKGDNSWLNILRNDKSSKISSEIKFPLLCNFYSEIDENKSIDKGFNTVDCVCNSVLKNFLNENKYKCLVRGHSHNVFSDKDIFGDGSCYSVHSNTADFYGRSSSDSTAGILLFDNDGEIKTKIEYTLKNTGYRGDKISNLFEVPNRKDEVNEFIKKNLSNKEHVISASPENFKKIVKNYRGALIFRGCTFENEEAAKGYENILFKSIEEAIRTNPKPNMFGRFYVYFAHNPYRALKYSLDSTSQERPIVRIYLAYHLDDTIDNYFENQSIAKNTSENIVICSEPFEFSNVNKEGEKIIDKCLSNKKIGWFRENCSDLENMIKGWITKCIGEESAEILWSYLSNDIKIET